MRIAENFVFLPPAPDLSAGGMCHEDTPIPLVSKH